MRLVCSLDRFTTGFNHCLFFDRVWRFHSISVSVFELLTPTEQHILSRVHIIVAVERSEVALGATAQTLGLASVLSSFSVPTPPLEEWESDQADGGIWDGFSDSD